MPAGGPPDYSMASHPHDDRGAPAVLLLALFVVAFLAGYLPLQQREATLRAETEAQQRGLPHVSVMRVTRGPDQNEIKLPGTMQALTEAPILARTDGYLKRRLVDIGDRVRTGQIMAEIDAPELDQQIHQAEAAIEQAKRRGRTGAGEPRAGQSEPRTGAHHCGTHEDADRTRDIAAAGGRSVPCAVGGAGRQRASLGEGDPRRSAAI